jgi:low temperature requirement protein LtrA
VSSSARSPSPLLTPTFREEERVTPLELFFDLVFVLALTQCTALMAHHPGWGGIGKALLVLALLWWPWVGYAWLTSVIDPEEGGVRLVMFAATAAFLVTALCVPDVYHDSATTFAIAYAVVRGAHIALFLLASREDPRFRQSVIGLGIGTATGVGLLLLGAALGGDAQIVIWAAALVLDVGEPYFFGAEGWKLVPGHFAERHGLIVIIALGESIVAIGASVQGHVTTGIVAAAVLGIALASAMWWAYFDVVALVAARRLASREVGREQNEMARDSYSYLHFPMVAGIVLVALGMKETIGDVGHALGTVPTFALVGGVGIYLLSHVAFRLRNVGTVNKQRLLLGVALLAVWPALRDIPALAAIGVVSGLLCAMIAYEAIRFAAARDRVRHQLAAEPPSP